MISDITPVNNYAGNGSTTSFDFDFYIEDTSQLKVYLINSGDNLTLLTEDIDYSVHEFTVDNSRPTPDFSEGGYIVYPITGSSHSTLSTDEKISLQLNIPFSQESEYGNSSLLNLNNLEFSFDYLTRLAQILKRQLERCAKVKEGVDVNPETLSQNINLLAEIKNDISTVSNAIDDIIVVSANSEDISTISDSIEDINSIAGDLTNIDAVNSNKAHIDSVAGALSDISDVADDLENINAVKNDLTNIDSVAGDLTNIDAVNSNKANIDTVAESISNVNAVGSHVTRVVNVADDLDNIDTISANLPIFRATANKLGDISDVADDLININSVAGDLGNIDSVAGALSNISDVADDLVSINSVAGDLGNIDSVAGALSNISDVADDLVNINSVAGDLVNINAVNSNKTNIDSIAANLVNISSVASELTDIGAVADDLININSVANDLVNIDNASTYADNANVWAEGTDEEVQALGGVHSAKGWAEESASGQVQSNWTETDPTSKAFILNKPTIPAAQIQSDWSQSDNTKKDFIKNKPTIPNTSNLANKDLSNLTATGEAHFQKPLVSGINIKTLKGTSLLGSGNIDTSEVFIAEYGVTSFADIQTAYNSGKAVFCKDGNNIYSLHVITLQNAIFTAISAYSSYQKGCDSNSVWQTSATMSLQRTSNLVTSLSSSSTNTQYPSAKCVYDQLELKQNASDKVNSISSSSTDTQYPSAKAVWDNTLHTVTYDSTTQTLTIA